MGTRRRFILGTLGTLGTLGATGALVIGWGFMPPRQRLLTAQPLPLGPGQQALNGWLKIGADDSVTVMLAKSEMGQGVSTSLAMLLAEELDADWAALRVEASPIDKIYNNLAAVTDSLPFHPDNDGAFKRGAAWMTAKTMREIGIMMTGGSSSIKDLWLPMREAGASARAMLVAAAAKGWGVPAAEVSVQNGVLGHAASGKSARFGELAAAAAQQALPGSVALKVAKDFKLIGRATQRLDTPAKSDGSAVFGIDVRPPGLLHASVVMCPTLGGSVASVQDSAARALPGVKQVVTFSGQRGGTGGVAVIADSHWRARQAVKALKVEWHHGSAAQLSSAGITEQLRQALGGEGNDSGVLEAGIGYHSQGDVRSAMATAAKTLKAEYQAPLLAHATMETMNCTVLVHAPGRAGSAGATGDAAALKSSAAPGSTPGTTPGATVWAPTQVPDLARATVAAALGLPVESITLNVTLLGGGFGRRLETDFIAQAATVAQAVPGTPVQTLWSREDDMTHDLYRPPCVARYQAGFDAQGALVAWAAVSASPSIVHQVLQRQFGVPGAGPDRTTADGAFDNPYEWPHARVGHVITPLPIAVGFWRSVGHSHQAFFKESFMDEAAAFVKQDPLAFRAALLKNHPRHLKVLQRAAELAGWGTPLAAAADGAGKARGIALHHSFGSIVAQVAEVSLDPKDSKAIRVHRVVAVIDCGTAVHPEGIRQQMEGAIVYGLTAALYGQITLEMGQVQQSNFHDQPALRLHECPVIETEIIASSAHPEGVGEPGTPPIAPAVANALFALTGQRLRSLPLRLG